MPVIVTTTASATNTYVRTDAILVAVMAVIAFYFFLFPVWRSQFLIEIWLTEGWNAYWQDAAIAGQTLYPSSDTLILNNYPPLSFYAVGLLGHLFGDNLFVGRSLSLISLLTVGVEIYASIRLLEGSRAGGAIGALWYVAIMSHNFTSYVGANDPQLAGEAIMGAGLLSFLDRERSGRSVMPSLLLMSMGGFWKHNMVAVPVTAILWLIMRRGRKSVIPIAVSVAMTLSGLALCGLIFGKDFYSNLLVARKYSIDHLLSQVGHLQWCSSAFLTWLVWVIFSRRKAAAFTALHVGSGLAACLLQWLGDGIFGNAEFDLILALGIAIGLTFGFIEDSPFIRFSRPSQCKAIMVFILAARLILTDRQEPLLLIIEPTFRNLFSISEQETRDDIIRVKAIKGPTYCDNKVVCRNAGKAFVVDDFKVEQMIATGLSTPDEVQKALITRNILTYHSPVSGKIIDASIARWIRLKMAAP